jgi:adenylate kinase
MAIILLLGAPGAGKGTQAEVLRDTLHMAHVSSGDLFRLHMKNQTPLGLAAKGYYDRGELVPDDIVISMILDRLNEPDTANGVILDGFPRTVAQAEALGTALDAQGDRLGLALYINVPTEVLLDRLSGRWMCPDCGAVYHEKFNPPTVAGVCDNCGGALYQRVDDKRETTENRLRVYFEQTRPVIEYYRQKGVLNEVDGLQSIEQVTADLLARIRPRGNGAGEEPAEGGARPPAASGRGPLPLSDVSPGPLAPRSAP